MSKKAKTLLSLLGVGLLLSSCGPKGNKPNVELIQDMMDQPAVKSQEYDPSMKNGISSLVPPKNTRPIGFQAYPYPEDVEAASANLKNPYTGNRSPEVLLTGQRYYNIQCMLCHGTKGLGDGPIAAKYPLKIPSLVTDKVKGWTDGHIYHVITMGQGTMGAYASHVPQEVRWQLVEYIRHLQSNKSE